MSPLSFLYLGLSPKPTTPNNNNNNNNHDIYNNNNTSNHNNVVNIITNNNSYSKYNKFIILKNTIFMLSCSDNYNNG